MRRKVTVVLVMFLTLSLLNPASAKADLPVVDFVNAALNELRNSLMQNQFAQEIITLYDQLDQLRDTYDELTRFHSGFEDFIQHFMADPLRIFREFQGTFRESYLGGVSSDSDGHVAIRHLGEILEGNGDPSGIRSLVERVSGEDPLSAERPYITFDEVQVGEGFLLAHEIRKRSDLTKEAGEQISEEAQTASPKGAARLAADGIGKVVVLTQQNQEATAKIVELLATQIEQVTRDEKRFERERLRYMEDLKLGIESLGRPN